MANANMVSQFNDYLRNRQTKNQDGLKSTHTRIPDPDKNNQATSKIYGGSYHIKDDEWSDFMRRYYNHVFVKNQLEYLTEAHLIEDGPILVDIDFRYAPEVRDRQHSEMYIVDAVMMFMYKINDLVLVEPNVNIDVFVMEKDTVNTSDSKVTKDGIHILIGLKMHKGLQVMLRKRIIPDLQEMWDDLPIINTWKDVVDEGVIKGLSNWQVYGSRKPFNQPYLVRHHWIVTFDSVSHTWVRTVCTVGGANFVERNFEKLSARYRDHPEFPMRPELLGAFTESKKELTQKPTAGTAAGAARRNIRLVGPSINSYVDISSEEILDAHLQNLFDNLSICDYRLKETHDLTMSLPIEYYGPGSYTKWIRVGWALANAGLQGITKYQENSMFLTFLKFCCQPNGRVSLNNLAKEFEWSQVPALYDMWTKFHVDNVTGLTHRSIMYWCKTDAPEKFEEIHKKTVEYFIEQSIQTSTEYDLAVVLYHLYKDRFVCASSKNKVWYEYTNNRWLESEANDLRQAISREMYQLYYVKTEELMCKFRALVDQQTDPEADKLRKASTKLSDICQYLKKTTWKNNIMREACEVFYVSDFTEKLDQNPYLMCFRNGVVDFKEKIFRKGKPDDYVSKCTGIDYLAYDVATAAQACLIKEDGTIDATQEPYVVSEAIHEFFAKLFPDESLRTYMWEHLASTMIGTNLNQTFNIYIGSGANGKSKMVDLFSKGMGQYKGTLPITFLTQKQRNSLGSTSSELAQLIGVRYAVMNEPSKGERINEGPLKEATGGDPIQARALFKESVTFIPQFKLVVLTNNDFEDMAHDDGTWRRIRKIDFEAKFMEKPYEDERWPRSKCPYQFPLDKSIDKQFDTWAPVLMAILVEKAFFLQGRVNTCRKVMSSSDKYREDQDFYTAFSKEMIIVHPANGASAKKVLKKEIIDVFRNWYIELYGNKNVPKGKEIQEFMNNRYGIYNKGWHNIEINYDKDADGDGDGDGDGVDMDDS